MIGCLATASFAISCAAPTTHVVPTAPAVPEAQLGRFMRESVNVPFAFVMLETATAHHRGKRVHKAATFLHDAARDLVDWARPPTQTAEAREVFYTYAQHLEYHAARLEDAAAQRETQLANDTVEEIRQTCNDCHHFFRPAAKFSPDVAYDWDALDLGGYR
jgi:hypothetical protein